MISCVVPSAGPTGIVLAERAGYPSRVPSSVWDQIALSFSLAAAFLPTACKDRCPLSGCARPPWVSVTVVRNAARRPGKPDPERQRRTAAS